MEKEFAEIIVNEGWDYNPEASWQDLIMQYWDYSQKLAEMSKYEPNKVLSREIGRLANDYMVLADQIVTERIRK